MKAEYEEDLRAELGYRTTGRREVAQREWFSLRGNPNEAAPTPKAFKSMAKRLMKLRSRRRKPDVYRAQWLRYDAEHSTERAAARRRRYWADAKRSRALRRSQRQRLAVKLGLSRKTCGACGQSGHNRRSHA